MIYKAGIVFMLRSDRENTKFYHNANMIIFALCFVTILIVDMFVGYSSGDDVSHQLMAEKYNLFGFIRNCETSRI